MSSKSSNTEAKSLISQTYWAQKLYNEATRQISWLPKPKPLTRWQRFRYRISVPFTRMRDAWLVLIGRAEIYDGQDD